MSYTLITGATGGLGKAFVKQCALRGDNLFLTGRSLEKLNLLKGEILSSNPDIAVEVFACRLHEREDRDKMFAFITSKGMSFSYLINVAGADIQKSFLSYTQEKIVFQTRVNFEAAVSVTRFVLDHVANNLKILSISSVSGIYPMPYFAIYSATKGATTSFFMALKEELKDKHISVTTVLPGAMPTREDVKEQIRGQGLYGKLAAKSPMWVAKKSLKALEKNKGKYIPGFMNKLMNVGTKFLPLSLKLKFIAKRWSKISKDAF